MAGSYDINNQIKANKINLVLPDGTLNEGISLIQALKIAEQEGLDVVEVSKNKKTGVSVCKVLDYGKMKYQQNKKKKEQKQINHTKEIKYSFNIDVHDLNVKHKKISKFLSKHYYVRYVLELRGREKYMSTEAMSKFNTNIEEFKEVATWKSPKVVMGGKRVTISTTLIPI